MPVSKPDAAPVCVVDCRAKLGEAPLWSVRQQALWWVDVARPTLWRHSPATGAIDRWELPRPPAALALRANGGLLILFRRGYLLVDALQPDTLIDTPIELPLDADRLNDGRVDAAGRMWVGSLDRQLRSPVGSVYRFSRDGALRVMDHGFALSNGMGWSPDRRTMYFAETHSRNVYAYTFDLENGTLADRRVFATLDEPGRPDGLTVDTQGDVWVAAFGGGSIRRYSPAGALTQHVRLPSLHPTSCTFGGPDLSMLYVTTASMDIDGTSRSDGPKPGALWAVETDTVGQAENLLAY